MIKLDPKLSDFENLRLAISHLEDLIYTTGVMFDCLHFYAQGNEDRGHKAFSTIKQVNELREKKEAV